MAGTAPQVHPLIFQSAGLQTMRMLLLFVQNPPVILVVPLSKPRPLHPLRLIHWYPNLTKNNIWVIFGIVAGGLLFLGILLFVVTRCMRKRAGSGTVAYTPEKDRGTRTQSKFKMFSLYKEDGDERKRATNVPSSNKGSTKYVFCTTISQNDSAAHAVQEPRQFYKL